MIYYLLIGLGVYMAMCAVNFKSFKGASFFAIIRGLIFGIFLWPAALVFLYFLEEK